MCFEPHLSFSSAQTALCVTAKDVEMWCPLGLFGVLWVNFSTGSYYNTCFIKCAGFRKVTKNLAEQLSLFSEFLVQVLIKDHPITWL